VTRFPEHTLALPGTAARTSANVPNLRTSRHHRRGKSMEPNVLLTPAKRRSLRGQGGLSK